MRKFLFYTLNIIWGFPTFIIGCILSLILLITGHKPKKHFGCWYFEVGKGWGGMEMGLMFLCSKTASIATKHHEFGHGIQTCVFGPFQLLIVSAPSAIRYWLREQKTQKAKKTYAVILYITMIIAALLLLLLTGFTPFSVIPGFIIIYASIIYMWLMNAEIPKYADNEIVPYDSVWFERSATDLGTDWATSKWGKRLKY